MPDLEADLFNLTMSNEAQPLLDAVKKHISENVDPITAEFNALDDEKEDRWSWHPRQLELLDGANALVYGGGGAFLRSDDSRTRFATTDRSGLSVKVNCRARYVSTDVPS